MMRPLRSMLLAVCSIMAACGPDGRPFWEACFESETVCIERETPERLSSHGTWEGTYYADRYFVGTNVAYLDWYGASWRLVLERSDILREPFYRTSSMVGEGSLLKGQTNFKAPYASDETWYLTGSYSMADGELRFHGRINTHGRRIGSFTMTRAQQCLTWEERIHNTCEGTTEIRRDGEYVQTIGEEQPAPDEEPVISYANVSPSPVSAGTYIDVSGSAVSSLPVKWTVTFAHTTTTGADLPPKNFVGKSFFSSMPAPSVAGTYLVTFEAANDAGVAVATDSLVVNPAP